MDKPQEMLGIAARDNNTKRPYLLINKLQGKHVPVSPQTAYTLFETLADKLRVYEGERLLLIGFAETATAIGAAVAATLDCHYMQTTRESIAGVDYLFFSEAHSHATEQKLVKTDLDAVIERIDRIVFIEDEVTTGNTIGQIVALIQKTYPQNLKFAVAALLSGITKPQCFADMGIEFHYLATIDHSALPVIAGQMVPDGRYVEAASAQGEPKLAPMLIPGRVDARRITASRTYQAACQALWEQIATRWPLPEKGKVLVLGTEEFMYPALFVARELQRLGLEARVHATTRSPILVSAQPDYPLHTRYRLRSLYDPERTTFVYDLGKYDRVIILTDGFGETGGLVAALQGQGNKSIQLVRWVDR